MVDVAKEVGLKYLVYSGARSEEGKPCRLLDAKATVEAYIKEQGMSVPLQMESESCSKENGVECQKIPPESDAVVDAAERTESEHYRID